MNTEAFEYQRECYARYLAYMGRPKFAIGDMVYDQHNKSTGMVCGIDFMHACKFNPRFQQMWDKRGYINALNEHIYLVYHADGAYQLLVDDPIVIEDYATLGLAPPAQEFIEKGFMFASIESSLTLVRESTLGMDDES